MVVWLLIVMWVNGFIWMCLLSSMRGLGDVWCVRLVIVSDCGMWISLLMVGRLMLLVMLILWLWLFLVCMMSMVSLCLLVLWMMCELSLVKYGFLRCGMVSVMSLVWVVCVVGSMWLLGEVVICGFLEG